MTRAAEPPGPPEPDEAADAEEMADADLDTLDALAEVLLDAVIGARTEPDLRRLAMPFPPEGGEVDPPAAP